MTRQPPPPPHGCFMSPVRCACDCRLSDSMGYFAALGHGCPRYVNPAGYFMDLMEEHEDGQVGSGDGAAAAGGAGSADEDDDAADDLTTAEHRKAKKQQRQQQQQHQQEQPEQKSHAVVSTGYSAMPPDSPSQR